jgi:hypothetical protein
MPSKISVRLPVGGWIGFRENGRCSITVWAENFKDLKIGDVVSLFNDGGGIEGDAKLVRRHSVAKPECVCDLHREVLVFAKVKKAKKKKK